MADGLHPPLDHLLDGHDLGSGQGPPDLGHHLLDGALGAQGRHLHQGDLALLVQDLLGQAKGGQKKAVVLGAGGFHDPADRKPTAVYLHPVSRGKSQDLGRLGPGRQALSFRPTALDLPPGLQYPRLAEVDPGQENLTPLDPDRAQDQGAHRGDVPGVLDGSDPGQIVFLELGRLHRHPAQVEPLIGQGKGLGLGGDQDVGPVLLQLGHDVGLQGLHQGDQGHRGGYPDQQPGQDKGGSGLAPSQVGQGDSIQVHGQLPNFLLAKLK